ncbi:MAG TPA: site-specific integrase [Bryobacteraceae bacterium]|nr:site-specific integrase [Bryobacteraceae bacterium]
MALYRRGQIWYADFFNGTARVQVSTGTANRREAEKFLALRISEVARGEYVKPARITLAELGKLYMDYAKANKRSWLRDQQILTHLNAALGTMPLPNITALPIERYKLDRLQSVTPATVNRELAGLKRMFNLAEQWGLFRGRNPVKGVKFLDENNLKLRTLSDEEEAALLSHCPPCIHDLVTFAVNTGLRLGDIFALQWREVDLEKGMLKMVVRKNRRILEMPLNDNAMAVVTGWHGIRKYDYVFYNPETGAPWKDLWPALKRASRKAGLQDVTWHTLRHTFASRLNTNGADLVTVKELLGHADIKTTMRYAHTNLETKRSAVRRLTCDKVVTVGRAGRKTEETV